MHSWRRSISSAARSSHSHLSLLARPVGRTHQVEVFEKLLGMEASDAKSLSINAARECSWRVIISPARKDHRRGRRNRSARLLRPQRPDCGSRSARLRSSSTNNSMPPPPEMSWRVLFLSRCATPETVGTCAVHSLAGASTKAWCHFAGSSSIEGAHADMVSGTNEARGVQRVEH